MPGYSSILAADGDESISVTNTAASLTLPAHFASSGVNAGRATIQCRTAPILFTLNGTAPTTEDASTGIRLEIGEKLVLSTLAEMRNLRMIRAIASNGAVFVIYERRVN